METRSVRQGHGQRRAIGGSIGVVGNMQLQRCPVSLPPGRGDAEWAVIDHAHELGGCLCAAMRNLEVWGRAGGTAVSPVTELLGVDLDLVSICGTPSVRLTSGDCRATVRARVTFQCQRGFEAARRHERPCHLWPGVLLAKPGTRYELRASNPGTTAFSLKCLREMRSRFSRSSRPTTRTAPASHVSH